MSSSSRPMRNLSGLSWSRLDWVLALILVLSVTLTYAPVWRAGFIWDDDRHLTANPCIVGPLGLKEIWTTSAADICPFVLTTFWAEHLLWGLDPLPYHLVNVLLHSACALLVWQTLRSLRVPGAWLGAALWALHPVEVESVAWVTEMKNTESGLFFLLSILFFVRWLKAKNLDQPTGGHWNYLLTLLFAALAMASKSSTVILPVVLGLCTWWIEGWRSWRQAARLIPIFLMSMAASALAIWTQGLQLATISDPQWVRTWPERLATAGDSIWFFLGKLLWPSPLMTIYPRWHIRAGEWLSYLPLLAVLAMLTVFWLRNESWSRACFFAFAYFTVALLPVLGLIDNFIFHYSLVFDHFQYLASIGPLALAAAGLTWFLDSILPKKAWLKTSLWAELLLILGLVSWQRTLVYHSPETLWTDELAKNPDCWVGYNNLGFVYLQKGQVDEALEKFQRALEIAPNDGEAHSNLGLAFYQKGRLDEAIKNYRMALKINPRSFVTCADLGTALFQKGQVDEAIHQYERALVIKPDYEEARTNLGLILIQAGRLDEAIGQFQEALRLKPGSSPARSNLARAEALASQRNGHQ